MLLLTLVSLSLIETSCMKAVPGQPVPHADVLDDLLSKFLGDSYSNNALFDFILGKPSTNRGNVTGDNLDISILDVNNVRNIIAFAKKRHEKEIMTTVVNTRRQYNAYPKNEAFTWNTYMVNKTLDLLKHTIYITKEKINETFPFRKKYNREFGYQIAILYGASAAILGKMEALYHQMKHFFWKTHFIWYLIVYEKMLACNIDIADSIEKIFLVQDKYEILRGDKEQMFGDGMKGTNLTRDQMKQLLNNPAEASKYQAIMNEHKKRFS